jgi:hypothetical protein
LTDAAHLDGDVIELWGRDRSDRRSRTTRRTLPRFDEPDAVDHDPWRPSLRGNPARHPDDGADDVAGG